VAVVGVVAQAALVVEQVPALEQVEPPEPQAAAPMLLNPPVAKAVRVAILLPNPPAARARTASIPQGRAWGRGALVPA
jgi:hypothetical protein